MEKVFEPFQSGFNVGTGLGLALVYQIIQAHQGSVQVESDPGKGARFIIDLPLEMAPSTLPKAATADARRGAE
jgi:two-component system sensor histidine kinase PilS (NtrC family)